MSQHLINVVLCVCLLSLALASALLYEEYEKRLRDLEAKLSKQADGPQW